MEGRFSREHIEELAHKYRNGLLTQQEEADFEAWYTSQDDETFAHPDARHPRRVMQRIYRNIQANIRPIAVRRLNRWLPYTAAAIVVLAIGFWVAGDRWPVVGDRHLAATEILPGGNRATLTLADGRTVDLSEAQTGIIVGEGITYSDGSEALSQDLTGHRSPTTHHMLTTPKGGQYQVTLPDGSKVWLNANSTLKYPSRFDGEERTVQLDGEAYFEIKSVPLRHAKLSASAPLRENSIPFLVKTSTQTVEVLGTEFNISAYTDEAETKTTLVEGRVKVSVNGSTPDRSPTIDHGSQLLSPGEQATTRGATIEIQKVDVSTATAWKDGRIAFNDQPIDAIMRTIARWYNVHVVYEGELPEDKFGGTVSRFENVSSVLRMLELTGRVRFRVEGRTIYVSK